MPRMTAVHEAPLGCAICGYLSAVAPCPLCGGRLPCDPDGTRAVPRRGAAPLDVLAGFLAFYRAALHLLTRKEYFGQLALPVAANLVASALVLLLAVQGLHAAAERLAAESWGALEFLRETSAWRGATLARVLTIVATMFVAPMLLHTITFPFLDRLADTTEKMLAGPALRRSERSRWYSALNMRASAQVGALQLLALVPCGLLALTRPGLVLAVLVAAALAALLWFEVPFARRGYGLAERWALMRRNWARALGFGLAFELGVFIPFLDFLLLAPAAAVAVSTIYFSFEKVVPASIVRPPP